MQIFQEHTVRFASYNIAKCCSDIRRVMPVLSRSVELTLRVSIEHVKQAFDEFFDSITVTFISGMGPPFRYY